jgi:hypothetical protein
MKHSRALRTIKETVEDLEEKSQNGQKKEVAFPLERDAFPVLRTSRNAFTNSETVHRG